MKSLAAKLAGKGRGPGIVKLSFEMGPYPAAQLEESTTSRRSMPFGRSLESNSRPLPAADRFEPKGRGSSEGICLGRDQRASLQN